MKADGWCCTICGRFDLREHPEQLAKPYHVSHRGADIGECPGTFMPFVWLSRMTDGEGGEQASQQADTAGALPDGEPRQPATPDAHGNASRNDETKPQQSSASDGVLDEIVESYLPALWQWCDQNRADQMRLSLRAACIRAREQADQASEIHYWRSRLSDAEHKLAAVVEHCEQIYHDHYREQGTDNFYHGQFDVAEDILAIARGEEGEHEEQTEAEAKTEAEAESNRPGDNPDHAGRVEPATPDLPHTMPVLHFDWTCPRCGAVNNAWDTAHCPCELEGSNDD